ncbi:RluA family pseudouridine synthase [Candidatus Parcubacteria bacterium]|nr:RluA family pseudouridine synthase [Candidatus Parcubacteria bacterium]
MVGHKIRVVHEDNAVLVVDKPSGLVVNRSITVKGRPTLQDWVEERFAAEDLFGQFDAESDFVRRSGIVHRLDKDTSGLLVLAKTPQAFGKLQAQFKKRLVKKTYRCLVHDKIREESFVIDAPLARNPRNRQKFAVVAGGREARAGFKLEKIFSKEIEGRLEQFSLLTVFPKTGRTHQIRVHLTAFSHPIVSDPLYNGRKRLRRDLSWCPRMFLHATQLFFSHPETEEWVRFESKLPEVLERVLEELENPTV